MQDDIQISPIFKGKYFYLIYIKKYINSNFSW